jgi:hypothetical protein
MLLGPIRKTSTEWKIAERQLSIKNSKSKSWFIDIKRLFIKYGIGDEALFACKMYVPMAIFRRIGILIISLMLALIVVASG